MPEVWPLDAGMSSSAAVADGYLPAMPSPSSFAAFALASFLLVIVPGPSVLFVISRGVALGRRAALATVVGNAAGVYVQALFVAVGLGAVISRSAALFTTIKLGGAAYLVYLGVQAIRHRRKLSSVLDVADVRPTRHLLREGFFVGLANPKATVFFAAILPQFVREGGAPAGLQMAVLALVSVSVALVSDGCWGVAAGSARAWLSASPRRLELLGGAGGITMIGLGFGLAASGGRRS
jgi:threonine/homoserine/homoserine lactone efflux protein